MRDFKDPVTLCAELEGLACLVCALGTPFLEEENRLSQETIGNALFAVQTYLERISDTIMEMDEPTVKEVKTA